MVVPTAACESAQLIQFVIQVEENYHKIFKSELDLSCGREV